MVWARGRQESTTCRVVLVFFKKERRYRSRLPLSSGSSVSVLSGLTDGNVVVVRDSIGKRSSCFGVVWSVL